MTDRDHIRFFSIHLHIVWVTKSRRKVGKVAHRVKKLIREEYRKYKVDILKGHVSSNHVHLLVSRPPQVTMSRRIQQMKGKSTSRLFAEDPQIRKPFWGRQVWARGYFARSRGHVTNEVLKTYLENQMHDRKDHFHIDGE